MADLSLVAFAVFLGMDWRVVALLSLALLAPTWAALAIGLHVIKSRRRSTTSGAFFCQTVARELRAGASLRWALASASRLSGLEPVGDALENGEPWDRIVPHLTGPFPDIGSELGVVIESVSASGAYSSQLFEDLGEIALGQLEAGEEIRIATASARASATVLIGLPVLYLLYQTQSGNLNNLLGRSGSGALALAGLGLALAGIAVSILLVRATR